MEPRENKKKDPRPGVQLVTFLLCGGSASYHDGLNKDTWTYSEIHVRAKAVG